MQTVASRKDMCYSGIAMKYMPDYLLFDKNFGPAYFDTWTFYETAKVGEGG